MKTKKKKQLTVANLKPNQYFMLLDGRSGTAFLFDEEHKITRLNDGVYITGLFRDRQDSPIAILTHAQAVERAINYRKESQIRI